jgi:hypothetical protein
MNITEAKEIHTQRIMKTILLTVVKETNTKETTEHNKDANIRVEIAQNKGHSAEKGFTRDRTSPVLGIANRNLLVKKTVYIMTLISFLHVTCNISLCIIRSR